jgi:hypothetical protein
VKGAAISRSSMEFNNRGVAPMLRVPEKGGHNHIIYADREASHYISHLKATAR